jgi:hypothetical protein
MEVRMKVLRGVVLFLASVGWLWAIEKPDDAPTKTVVGICGTAGAFIAFTKW